MKGNKIDLLVFGETTLDTISHVERLSLPEGAAPKILRTNGPSVGGRGTNVGTYASIMGANVALISACGIDYKKKYDEFPITNKINHDYLFIDDDTDSTAKAIVFRDPGQAITYFHPGLIGNKNKLKKYKSHIRKSLKEISPKFVYCTSELHGMVDEVFKFYSSSRETIKVYAPGPEVENIKAPVLKRILNNTDIVFLNYKEMTSFQSILETQISEILSLYSLQSIIITIGEIGALLLRVSNKKLKSDWYPSYPVKKEDVIDTTGAGDSLAGAFLGNMTTKKTINLPESLRYGIVTSSIVVQHQGCLVPHLSKSQIADRLKKYPKLKS